MKIDAFITVRTSSRRLKKKCLLPFGDGNVLEHIIRRTKNYDLSPILCTSIDSTDDEIEKIAIREKVPYFRGSLINKLKRWSDCATCFGIEKFHTVDADDPFFNGDEIINSMTLLRDKNLDIVYPSQSSASGGASVGYSLTADLVKRAIVNLPDEIDTEMMWYHIEKIADFRSDILSESSSFLPQMRLTLDYEEDYWLLESVRRMVGNLAPRKEVNQLFERNPDLYKINWFRNEEWKAGQIAKRI